MDDMELMQPPPWCEFCSGKCAEKVQESICIRLARLFLDDDFLSSRKESHFFDFVGVICVIIFKKWLKSICSASQLPLYCLCAFAQAPGSWGAVRYQVARMRIRANFPEEAHSIKHTASHHGAPKVRRGHVYMYDVYVNIERETYIETYMIYHICIYTYVHTYTVHVLCMYSCIRCHFYTQSGKNWKERGVLWMATSEVSVHPICPPYPCYRCPPIHGWVSRRCFAVHRPVVRVHRKVMCSEAPTFGHSRLESLCWNAMVPHHTEYVYTVYLLWVPTE